MRLLEENLRQGRRIKEMEEKLAKLQGGMIKQTDTTSHFALPSEFRGMWESFVKETLVDAFSDILAQPRLLITTLNSMLRACSEAFERSYQILLQSVLRVVNQKDASELEQVMKPYFREHYTTIFTADSDAVITQALHQLLDILSIEDQSTVEVILSSNEDDIKGFISSFKNLWLYMRLAEPRVTLDVNLRHDQALRFTPDKYTVVDGFEKEDAMCLVVMNAPMLSSGSFAGIKPAVVILGQTSAEFSLETTPLKEPKSQAEKQSQEKESLPSLPIPEEVSKSLMREFTR